VNRWLLWATVAAAVCNSALAGEAEQDDLGPVRPIDRWIDLGGETRPVAILCPDRPAYRQAAERIAQGIERLGATRPGTSCDAQKISPETHTVIALGNVNNNRLIARLYFNYYAYEDSLLPGPNGFSLRTVYDPYPWHGRGDVVVVGISNESRAVEAAGKLAERIRRGKTKAGVDYLLEVSTAPPPADSVILSLQSKRSPSFHVFLDSASRYLKTGQEAYARHAIATLHRILQRYRDDPDSDCDWPEETNSAQILATWDAFEECPLLTDAERHEFSLAFLRFMRSLKRHVSGYSRIGTDDLVTWNHTTFPLLGMYFGSRYFRDYYALPEADRYLEKAKACFTAQARSWKPQEDADTYLIITMGHTIRYCLAEWNLEFFQSGRMRRYADYVISICDSRGWLSGFGDSGIGRAPLLIQRAVPLAFWWYRDPGYLWVLDHVSDGRWENPFHRNVRSRRPGHLTGIRVFHLDPQLYEYTRRRSFYNEPVSAPKVPPESAIDKIAFRESWDKASQYTLLDGFGRGRHLHYDTGAIIVLVDRGERWLLDHDYLTRNTTEHNMLSVIQNGRSKQLVPSCAGLICQSDLGGPVGLVGTEVRDYCGIDWRRYVFWRKGDALVILDRMTAREPADYDLDLVWKVEDRGDETLAGERAFVVRRGQVPWRWREVSIVEDPQASGGKAALLHGGVSALALAVDLPAGEYRLAVRAYGEDTASDSLLVHTSEGTTVVRGIPRLGYGPDDAKRAARSAISLNLTDAGRQLISLTLRRRPPVRVDKLMLFDADGKLRLVVEAEDAPAPTEDEIAALAAKRFWIKWSDQVQSTVKRSHPKGIVVPVCKLYQRMSRRLAAGETAELANLLYTDESTEPLGYQVRHVSRGAVLVVGPDSALCAVRGASFDGLQFDADMLYLSSSHIAWANGRSLRLGETMVDAPALSNLELDLASLKATAQTADGQRVAVRLRGVSADGIRQFLDVWAEAAPEVKGPPGPPIESLPVAKPTWTRPLGNRGPVRRLKLADLDQDGTPEILAAAGPCAYALDGDGRVRWSYPLGATCHDVEAGELDAAAEGMEVVVAGGDTYVHLLSAGGELISKHQIRGPVWNQNFGDRPWQAYTVAVRDLEQDGRREILVGTQNYELHIYDAQWKQRARARRAVLHGSIDFLTADTDGDGKLEIFATDHYGYLHAFRHDGTKLASFYTSIGDMRATLADLDGDGRIELVYGSSTGDLVATKLPKAGPGRRGSKTLWRFDNFGYGVNRLRSVDIEGDGKAEVIVASQTGYLYVLDGTGRLRWQDRAGVDIVEALVLADSAPRLAYLDHNGVLTLATGPGDVRKRIALAVTPKVAIQLGGALVVGTLEGLSAFSIDELWNGRAPVGTGVP